uniref:Ankyrin repeat and ubiquitin domain containing 1 n=1 Tax=Callorhinchus milii TaxID=7868 RepID=A0A4W3I5S5_CALMI
MRIFVAFENVCEPFDILPTQTVQSIKLMIQHHFHISLSDDKQGRRFLQLIYAGAVLQESWVLADVGVTPCSTIRCLIKEEEKPVLYIYNSLTRQTLPIMERPLFLSMTVASLKSLVSLKSGLPVSTFRLSTSAGTELYNCNRIDDYHIDLGSTIRLDVWDGWKVFLTGCLLGRKHIIQRHLSEEKPTAKYQRVALYLAAYLGYLDLASWLLQQGVRADLPVGIHPYREWCHQTDHPDISKCAVHAAAETGQLMLLKAFLSNNLLCLECQTSEGRTPLKICIQHGHKECVLYLVAKLWSVVSFAGLPIPLRLYVKIKRWLSKAQRRVRSKQLPEQVYKTRVGDTIFVDGFTEAKMTSKLKDKMVKKGHQGKGVTLPPLNYQKKGPSAFHSKQGGQVPTKPLMQQKKSTEPLRGLRKMNNLDQNMCRVNVSLPPVSRDTNPRPQFFYSGPNPTLLLTSSLDSFYHHTGRTPRENAIYCLALARGHCHPLSTLHSNLTGNLQSCKY